MQWGGDALIDAASPGAALARGRRTQINYRTNHTSDTSSPES